MVGWDVQISRGVILKSSNGHMLVFTGTIRFRVLSNEVSATFLSVGSTTVFFLWVTPHGLGLYSWGHRALALLCTIHPLELSREWQEVWIYLRVPFGTNALRTRAFQFGPLQKPVCPCWVTMGRQESPAWWRSCSSADGRAQGFSFSVCWEGPRAQGFLNSWQAGALGSDWVGGGSFRGCPSLGSLWGSRPDPAVPDLLSQWYILWHDGWNLEDCAFLWNPFNLLVSDGNHILYSLFLFHAEGIF